VIEKSKSRIEADAAFLKTQTEPLSSKRMRAETNTVNQVRDANTAKLKAQRLEKEALDRATSAAAPSKPGRRTSIKGS
jgi:hypothetical protein